MLAAQGTGKRRRIASSQRLTYREQVLQVVKNRFAAVPLGQITPALRLPAAMESNGEAPSIISQALWRLGHLQGMLLLMDLRDRQLLPERPESFSWATEELFVKLHNIVIAFLFENCHSPQSDATTMIAAPAHLLKVERTNDLVYSGLQVAKARGQLDLFIERLEAVTARRGPSAKPAPRTSAANAAGLPMPPALRGHYHPMPTGHQTSSALDVEQTSHEPLEPTGDSLPSRPQADDHLH